jgi:S1-C subfamily serine protease
MLLFMQQRQRGLWAALVLLLLVLGGALGAVLYWHNTRITTTEGELVAQDKRLRKVEIATEQLFVDVEKVARKTEDLSKEMQEVRAKLADHSTNFLTIQAKQKEVDRQTDDMRRELVGLDGKLKTVAAENRKPEDVYRRALASTAWVLTGGSTGTGALIVDGGKRYVLTAYHVVHKARQIDVIFPRFYEGKVLANERHYETRDIIRANVVSSDPKRDLALLELVRMPEHVLPVPVADASPDAAARVHTVGGHPESSLGLWVYSQGAVREIGQARFTFENGQKVEARVVRTTNPINRGDSGALLNDHCQLVGVTCSGTVGVNLVGSFIDVSEVRAFLASRPTIVHTDPPPPPTVPPPPKGPPTEPVPPAPKKTEPPVSEPPEPDEAPEKGPGPKPRRKMPPAPRLEPTPGPRPVPRPSPRPSPRPTTPTPPPAPSRLFVLFLLDTTDRNLASFVVKDAALFERAITLQIPAHRLHLRKLWGPSVNRRNIATYLATVPITPNDTLLVYYNGHGCMIGRNHFLDTGCAGPAPDKIFRGHLAEAMLRKGVRLTILLTYSCANFVGPGPGVEEMRHPRHAGRGLAQLVFSSSGFVDWSSCSPGEFSFTDTFMGPLVRGTAESANWHEAFTRVSYYAEQRYQAMRPLFMRSPGPGGAGGPQSAPPAPVGGHRARLGALVLARPRSTSRERQRRGGWSRRWRSRLVGPRALTACPRGPVPPPRQLLPSGWGSSRFGWPARSPSRR